VADFFNLELKGLRGLRELDTLNKSPSVKTHIDPIQHLSIDSLVAGKYQPRQWWSEEELFDLSESIREHGIIQPLIVRRVEEGRYEIIAGERRWRAARLAGLETAPAIVRDIEDNIALAFALIENIQRQDLNPLEEAVAFARFKDEFAMTHADIAKMVGRSRTSVTNTMRLLSLCDPVKQLLTEGRVEMGHARALLTLDAEQQTSLAHKIVMGQLTVRQAEKLADALKFPSEISSDGKNRVLNDEQQSLWCEELAKKLSARVTIKLNNKGAGKVVIHVESPEEFAWLIEHIDVR